MKWPGGSRPTRRPQARPEPSPLPSCTPLLCWSFTQGPTRRPGTPNPNTLAFPLCQNFPSEDQRHTLQTPSLPAGRSWGLVPFGSHGHQPPALKGQRTPTASFPRACSSDDQNLLAPTWGRWEEAQVPTGARWAKETHLQAKRNSAGTQEAHLRPEQSRAHQACKGRPGP